MIYCLGPEGSYTSKAAKLFSKMLNNDKIIYCKSIYEVFENVNNCSNDNNICYGVVPSENSIEGSVSLTMDLLLEFPVKILGEIDLPINHCLIGYDKNKIKKILAHPQALAQCRKYIQKNNWDTESVLSNSKGVEKIKTSGNKELGAIASEEAGNLFNVPILEKNIEDYKNNTTRFIIFGKDYKDNNNDYNKNNNNNHIKFNKKPKYYKSTIIVELKEDKPGALYNILKEFNNKNINLTKIESRPSKNKIGNYIFYMDYLFNDNYNNEKQLIKLLEKHISNLKYLGNYPVIEYENN